MNQFLLAFLTGLTSGGVSCVAIQGVLLFSVIPNKTSEKIKAILYFLDSKLIAYIILGAILGLIGESLIISPKVQGWFQIFTGIYMLATAARLLDLHPIFRHFAIQPPKFIFRLMRKFSVSDSPLTPFILGILTVLIPCGVTQAMMFSAVGTRSAVIGAGIMFSFILGTFPIFFLFGLASVQIFKNKILVFIAAIIVAFIGLFSINTGQILRGSPHTFQNYLLVIKQPTNIGTVAGIQNGVQKVNIEVNGFGYKSDITTVKVGVPVKLNITTKNELGCGRSFVIPSLNYSKILPATGNTEIVFTPKSVGTLTYSCSMGMYTGSLNIIQ